MTWKRRIVGTLLLGIVVASATATGAERETAAVLARMKADIFYLAGDECNGRGVGTPGIDKAAEFVATRFREAGLQPITADGSYYQPFSIFGGAQLGTPNTLRLMGPADQAIEVRYGSQFVPTGMTATGTGTGELVFVGYGITSAENPKYDDYAGIDVAGKFVVVMRRTPRADNKEKPFSPDEANLAALITKVETASKNKAAGVIFVNDSTYGKDQDALLEFRRSALGGTSKLPILHMKRSILEHMLLAQDQKLSDIETAIDKDLTPRSMVLKGWKVKTEVTVKRSEIKAKNVVGVLPGSGPLADETIVIGAHYDHLGTSSFGSLAGQAGEGKVHFGADDNASGTTGLIELARRFGSIKNREGRRIVFIAFSGEERGLHGSIHYCKEPVFPLDKTVFMLNMDMIGRVAKVKDGEAEKDRIVVYGHGSGEGFEQLVDKANKTYDFKLFKIATGTGPSDHDSFYRKRVPVLFFFSGTHRDYHRPTDTPEKINLDGMMKVAGMAEGLAQHFATVQDRPKYQVTSGGWTDPTDERARSSPRAKMPKLGIMPGNYEEEDKGVLVEEVTPGGAAEKGGIKAGDAIISIGGKPVKNINDYMSAMTGQKAGQELEVTVLRKGKKVPVKVVPQD